MEIMKNIPDQAKFTVDYLPSKKNPKYMIVVGFTIKKGVYKNIDEVVNLEAK